AEQHFGNPYLPSEMPHLRLAIARKQHDPVHTMARSKVAHERIAIEARCVQKAKRRRVLPIEKQNALHPWTHLRKSLAHVGPLRQQMLPPRDLDQVPVDPSAQSLARLLADLPDLAQDNIFAARGIEDARRQRMFRILLQARGHLQCYRAIHSLRAYHVRET